MVTPTGSQQSAGEQLHAHNSGTLERVKLWLFAPAMGRQAGGSSVDGLGEETGWRCLPERRLLTDGARFGVHPSPMADSGLLRDTMTPDHPVFPDPDPCIAHSADSGKWSGLLLLLSRHSASSVRRDLPLSRRSGHAEFRMHLTALATIFPGTSPDLSSGLMAGAERQLAPFVAAILASGCDNGPAAGPGGRGFHRPRGFSFLDRSDGLRWSGGLRERVDPLPRGRDRFSPRPGRLDFQASFPPAAHQAGRGV